MDFCFQGRKKEHANGLGARNPRTGRIEAFLNYCWARTKRGVVGIGNSVLFQMSRSKVFKKDA